jgi:SAM-dependent methyltransferase
MTRRGSASTTGAPIAVASIDAALAALPGARILDARDDAAFARGHVEGAGRVSLDEFVPRRAELPSRGSPVIVVHDEPARAREAAEALVSLGYERVAWLDRALGSEPRGHGSRASAARLWSPSAFIEREAKRAREARAGAGPGHALDLACGSGRAAVFLALEGWRAEGWDGDASALDRARALAERHGTAASFSQRDLERETPPDPAEPFDLIVVVRYLHRPLFPWIGRALAPGGVLLYETFRDGQQRFGPPRRDRHLLRKGELLTAFPSLDVLHHEETPDDAPPVLARLAARRPG